MIFGAVFTDLPIFSQSPGDKAPLAGVHPGYSLSSLTPAGFQPGVSGMDFLSNGNLVICTWGGNHKTLTPPSRNGEVYILDNVAQEDSSKVIVKKFATGLQEPLGLKVVNDTIYLSERQALSVLVDKNKDGVVDSTEYRKLAAYKSGAERHEFFFGLIFKDGYFYGAHSISLLAGGKAAVPQPDSDRGTYIRVNKATGQTELISGGAREPFGFVMNPAGEIFSTEVQGTWNPACAFTQVRAGRFYGHPQPGQVPPDTFESKPYNAPAVLMPESEISNAPGQPVYVAKGMFQGQYLLGDVTYGGIHRIYLEKVAGEYQGGIVRFTAGLASGVSRLAFGPNGDLYVGEIGDADGNWNESGKRLYGLQKLKANGKSAFEILNVRSRPKGMEIEFTEPVALDAETLTKYAVSTWTYVRTADYGGPKVDPKNLTVTSVQVDSTRRKVYLELQGLKTGYLVYIRLVGLKSAAGNALWSTETWYTLNAFGTGNAFDPVGIERPESGKLAANALTIRQAAGRVNFQVTVTDEYDLSITDARGALKLNFHGRGPGNQSLEISKWARGGYLATLKVGERRLAKALALY